MFRFPLAARRAGAQVIHTQYNLSPLAGHIGVTTIHDVSFLIEPSWFQPKDQILLSRFVHPSARRAARVITVSETSRIDISRHMPDIASKIRVTPLASGLGVKPIGRSLAQKTVETDLGILGPYMLTVGTRWPRKNMSLAVEAVDLLPEDQPHQLVVTGKLGWGEERASSRVRATGFVTDEQLSALYSAADLYLAPSRYEGFGLTLLEAFSCQCPVLCSMGGSQPEIAGDAAGILHTWDAEDWSRAITRLMNDPSKLAEMRELGLKRASEFSWKRTAELTYKVYEEVIG